MNIKKYTVGSLYAGIGGICQGFIDAGADVKWANEFDKNACETYRFNFKHLLYEEDIWKLPPEQLEPVNIIAAGFPCQPFSVAGYKKGFEDERGNHFFRIIQYIKALDPDVLFLENVKNLMGHDNGHTYEVIKEALEANDFSVDPAVLNTKDYGNIPQTRERIYIVSFNKKKQKGEEYARNFKFPDPIPLTKTIWDLIEKEPVDERYYYREDKYMFPELAKSIKNKNTLYQWRRMYVRENKSNVCPTLTANMGTGGHNVPLVLTDFGIRKLTPRECFNFQGFHQDFKIPNNMGISQLYKQAGNSVSVPVIARIAKNIISVLNGNEIEPGVESFERGRVTMKKLF